ncbi:MAG: tRNA-(ms[2]io[6]A)-hydroxylase [Deltaproteobacteria bacterium]|nr:tRNA-(ms[2]io[6]A)-hydroxylase [Deltaproteobacteria bacterium]
MLLSPSPSAWLDRVLVDLDTLLVDHAHCEKRAASVVLGFSFRAPEHEFAGAMSRLAREELIHFEMVQHELRRRGRDFEALAPSRYAAELAKGARRKDLHESMADSLVIAALIEARSHERLVLLRDAVSDSHLQALYAALVEAESRHASQLLELAARWSEPRLSYFATREAELIAAGEPIVRMHS